MFAPLFTFGFTEDEYAPGERERIEEERRLKQTAAGRMLLYIRRHPPRGPELHLDMRFQFDLHFFLQHLVHVGIQDEKAGWIFLDFVQKFVGWVIEPATDAGFGPDQYVCRAWTVSVHLLPRSQQGGPIIDVPYKNLFELHVEMNREHDPTIQASHFLRVMWVQVTTAHLPSAEEFRYHEEADRVLAARPAEHSATSNETIFHMRWFRPGQGRAYWDTATAVRREKADLFAEWRSDHGTGYDQASEDYIVVRFKR
ncbi:hypothetical protein JCM10450v2_003022 [Rhodotorula kratochvilovae]